MDTVDSAGAEGVARYFLALMPYAEATGDLTQIRSLSATECVFCTSVIDGVTKESQAGRHSTGGLVHISAAKALEVDPGKWWAVTVELTQDPSQTVDATGVPVEQKAAEVVGYHMDFAVIREGDRWLAREIGYEVVSRTAP